MRFKWVTLKKDFEIFNIKNVDSDKYSKEVIEFLKKDTKKKKEKSGKKVGGFFDFFKNKK